MLIRGVYGMFVHEEYGMHTPELYAGMLIQGSCGSVYGIFICGCIWDGGASRVEMDGWNRSG